LGAIPRVQLWLLAFVAVGIPVSAWGAVYPPNTWLQVGPIALLLIAAVPTLRRWPLSNVSAASLIGFLLLHLLAARWTYSDVPYVAWGQALLGFDVDAAFGFKRNMFDRLVHFGFGALFVVPMVELMTRHGGQGRRMALYSALMFVLGASALYEIFEWLLAVWMSPEAAEAYNGQQGDMFDGSKDMAMATLGAILAGIGATWRRRS
jgi:putative membrane protein